MQDDDSSSPTSTDSSNDVRRSSSRSSNHPISFRPGDSRPVGRGQPTEVRRLNLSRPKTISIRPGSEVQVSRFPTAARLEGTQKRAVTEDDLAVVSASSNASDNTGK